MHHKERFVRALAAPDPAGALRSLAVQIASEGSSRQEVYKLFEEYLIQSRQDQGHTSEREDILLDVMDALVGWCHPAAEIVSEKEPG